MIKDFSNGVSILESSKTESLLLNDQAWLLKNWFECSLHLKSSHVSLR